MLRAALLGIPAFATIAGMNDASHVPYRPAVLSISKAYVKKVHINTALLCPPVFPTIDSLDNTSEFTNRPALVPVNKIYTKETGGENAQGRFIADNGV
jgi:aspartate/glutamate racemase